MNYEITVYENESKVKVSASHDKWTSEREYKYRSYGFGRMTNRYNDSPQVFIIEIENGGEAEFNLNNISAIIYN
jgi:hypothetical protein